MSQLTYSVDQPIAFAGMLADISPNNDKLSRVCQVADGIPAGIVVKKGTNDEDAILVTDAAGAVLGIALHSHAAEIDELSGTSTIPEDASFNVLAHGRVYVQVEEAVVAEAAVYVRVADGVADPEQTQKGAFRGSADTATARVLTGAKYKTSASAGGFAVVELNGQLSLA